ncbi:MAG: Rieske 2Fe-2S domain-containing protein [Caldilineaceae bacterium SB0665_bin_21]|nr:Rieske 2Fe-2S domain-containing protein [Caldilineaceae bacterium SB0665_bin_21]MYA03123.1 Rieske 2Fe-2S domain-containing protein [Caldilineaceae bacterium SB0664_bin_22]MYC63107.1 Rieske 2Fe-2S domain-containing protein [Caldilineaceae bacterium SB0661_bin_34]
MAELSSAGQAHILEAKRRAAERLGIPFDPEATDAAPAPSATEAPSVPEPEARTDPPATEASVAAETETAPSIDAEAPEPPVSQADTAPAATTPSPEPAAPAATPARPQPSPAAPAAPPEPEVAEPTYFQSQVRTVNRREFLAYSWTAAVGVVTAQSLVATGLLMYPRFKAGEFGGDFLLGSSSGLPSLEAAPQSDPIGKFWLVNTDEGPRALYMVCTHLGCLFKWVDANKRFECPCHGSKFTREGVYIEGPAPRSLDQFVIEVTQDGSVVASTQSADGGIQPPGTPTEGTEIVVKTGSRIQGPAIP